MRRCALIWFTFFNLSACTDTTRTNNEVKALKTRLDSIKQVNIAYKAKLDSINKIHNSLGDKKAYDSSITDEMREANAQRLSNLMELPRFVFAIITTGQIKYELHRPSLDEDIANDGNTQPYNQLTVDTSYYWYGIAEVSVWNEDEKYKFLDECEAKLKPKLQYQQGILQRTAYVYDSYAEASKSLQKWK